MSDSTESTPITRTAPDTSSTPTSCEYDNSVGEFLKCNKEKFTTTQLVGAGIGVTLLIFGIAFGIIWFCRRQERRKIPSKEKRTDVEKSRDSDEEDDSEDDSDEEEDERHDEGISRKDKDKKSPSVASGPAARVRAAQQAVVDERNSVRENGKAPPRPPRTEQTLGHDLNPANHTSSRVSSRAGSPTGPPVRNLSLTNPDYRKSGVSVRPSRPPSNVTAQAPQRPKTAYQDQHRPAISSSLKPQNPRTVRASSYVPQAGDRRPSQVPTTRAHSVHPPSGDSATTRSSSRSPSVYSNMSRKASNQDIPLPALPFQAYTRSRGDSIISSSSRRNTVTRNDDPPGYTSSSSRETSPKMRVQAPPRLINSHQGISRTSSAASIQSEEVFLDAHEEPVKSRRVPRKQQAIIESPLPYE